MKIFKKVFKLIKDTYISWNQNEPWAKSAVIAYYALFSLPSLLIITIHFAGVFFGSQAVQGRITREFEGLIGEESAQLIQSIIVNSSLSSNSTIFIIVGIGTLIFGATGVFVQLQKALNDIWGVRLKKTGILSFIRHRALAFGMVLVIGLLLLISLVLSTAINAFSDFIGSQYVKLPPDLIRLINFLISQIIITALFTTIYTLLPDVKVKWKTNIIGAAVTTLLFLIGKYLIGFYFSTSDPASAYGAAGSLVLILLWVYYTCLILFFGAEFTVNWALMNNIKIEPTNYAAPSYEQELEKLRAYKQQVEERKKKMDQLCSGGDVNC